MSLGAYEDLAREVLSTGIRKDDRTGTGTISTFGKRLEYDLAEGFPLITTKRVWFRGVAEELFWFIRGETNSRSLEDKGVNIWRDWADEEGELGPLGYSTGWRSWYTPTHKVVEVRVRQDTDAGYERKPAALQAPIDCDLNSDECWAIAEHRGMKNTRYTVQFPSGGTIETSRPNWRAATNPASLDPYHRSVAGVGYLGGESPKKNLKLYNLWCNMIQRCYNPEHPNYSLYGGSGVTVSPIWHDYSMFVKTIGRVPGYHLWLEGEPMVLDKDYFGARVYSPNTAAFIRQSDNVEITADGTCVEVEGVKYTSLKDWARRNDANSWYAKTRWQSGKSYRGIAPEQVRVLEPREGYVWRRQVYIDQLSNVVEQLRSDPYSRRHLVSAWNVAVLDDMALVPCHVMFQFYVADGKLSTQVYQRSADVFLGLPFNIASYALLTHMVAQQTGLDVGKLVWVGGDVHIYSNHIEAVKEQLGREPYPFPDLDLKPAPTLFDYTLEHANIIGYRHHPAIKAPVAV